MHPLETIGSLSFVPETVLETAASLSRWLSGELLCSATVNTVLFTVVLLGAVRLMLPYGSYRRDRGENS